MNLTKEKITCTHKDTMVLVIVIYVSLCIFSKIGQGLLSEVEDEHFQSNSVLKEKYYV